MAGGWAHDGAVQEQIDATVEDAVKRARAELPVGPGAEVCDECAAVIPQARRAAIAGVRMCVACQTQADEKRVRYSGYNRRASKDSQLR